MQRLDVQILNTQKHIVDWKPPFEGTTEVRVETSLYSEEEFLGFLTKMKKEYGDLPIRHRPRLSFGDSSLVKDSISALIECANSFKEKLPFSEITLCLHRLFLIDNFKCEIIFDLIEALNETPIQRLHLITSPMRMRLFLENERMQKSYYPITMDMLFQDEQKEIEGLYFDFWQKRIPAIQTHHQADPAYLKKRLLDAAERKDDEEIVRNDPTAPKIKLKKLITQLLYGQERDPDPAYDGGSLIVLEEQQVEQEEVVQVVEEVVEEAVVENQVEEEQQQQREQYQYGDPLIDDREFIEKYLKPFEFFRNSPKDPCHIQGVRDELFFDSSDEDLRGQICFLSPEAAVVIANHLSVFISLNLNNLPPFFVIKERMYKSRDTTKERIRWEGVLHYDPFREPSKTNAYTPKKALRHDNRKDPVYPIQIVGRVSEDLRSNPKHFALIQQYEAHLINLWIYHGDKGVHQFCDYFVLFDETDANMHAMKKCLLENYLKHFPHWDHFLDDNSFFECLKKIHDYKPAQRACLQKFLKTTGISHHDLSDTLIGFDEFWEEWTQICETHQIDDLACLAKPNWHTRYGHPVVYMERLITILKNARDLDEQIGCLEGIILDSYDLYYDSKYRHFKTVSLQMQKIRGRILYDKGENEERRCYRKIGRQLKSIPVKALVKNYESYKNQNKHKQYDRHQHDNFVEPYQVLQTALFFIQHERYTSEEDILQELFKSVQECIAATNKLSVYHLIDGRLQQLLNQGCLLSPAEGILICQKIKKEYTDQYHTFDHGSKALENLGKKIEGKVFNLLQDAGTRVTALKSLEMFYKTSYLIKKQVVIDHLNRCWNDAALADQAQGDITRLDELWQSVRAQPYFKKHRKTFGPLFNDVRFDTFPYGIRFQLLNLLQRMRNRHYAGILGVLLKNSDLLRSPEQQKNASSLLAMITDLHDANFSSQHIEKIVGFVNAETLEDVHAFVVCFLNSSFNNKDNALTKWIITDQTLPLKSRVNIAQLTKSCEHHRDAIKKLFVKLQADPSQLPHFLEAIGRSVPETQAKILEIIACRKTKKDAVDYIGLVTEINKLNIEEVEQLYQFFKTRTGSASALLEGLRGRNANQSLEQFLADFEKAPFGARDINKQFEITQVERVVNGLYDMLRDRKYPYAYRKQVMEAFLFINEAGHKLKIYKGKSANELSDEQIKALFREIKENKPGSFCDGLTRFQRQLLALGLIREAVSHITDEFSYSTQMTAVINCMMQICNGLSRNDTGEGKSLMDAIKAMLLWIDSHRVDVSTASIVDAKRDLETYSLFFDLLGIPHAKAPITTESDFKDYQPDGVNHGVIAQFALFYMRAKAEGLEMGQRYDQEEKKEDNDPIQPAPGSVEVSLILNESDYTLLEDIVIDRYATSSGAGVGFGNEWVYTALNTYVQQASFKKNDTSAVYDIAMLRNYLKQAAIQHKKSPSIVNKFLDKQLRKWIESAILVNYRLRVNHDYVLTLPEEKQVKGVLRLTRSARILMKDGKVSGHTQYGNGMQQLLHAKLNADQNTDVFLIEPESKTIMSLNNLAIIRYYLTRGFIWGSSATPGDAEELAWSHKTYGFTCSNVEPHREKKVIQHGVETCEGQVAHFNRLQECVLNTRQEYPERPIVVFLKDIDTTTAFFNYLEEKGVFNKQLHTGIDCEEDAVEKAGQPGFVTVTTGALGRNTNILYDRKVGMNIIIAFPDTLTKEAQRSGRTGREGSPGDTWRIYNADDLKGQTIEQIRSQLKLEAQRKREFNNELYGVLGFLLERAGVQNRDFFIQQWADFTSEVESRYRVMKMENAYTLEDFVKETVQAFNLLVQEKLQVTEQEVLSDVQYTYPPLPEEGEAVDEKPVLMNDCTPPEMIAQSFFPPFLEAEYKRLAEEVQKHLIDEAKTCRLAREELTKQVIECKAEVDRLGEQVKTAQAEGLAKLKPLLISSLETYSKQWFVNENRRQAALELINEINAAQNTAGIMKILRDKQLAMVKSDIAENKNCLRIKPLHWMKHSRFHTVLNNALQRVSETEKQAEEKDFEGKLEEARSYSDDYNEAVIYANIRAAQAVEEAKPNETGQKIAASVLALTDAREKVTEVDKNAQEAKEREQKAEAACRPEQVQEAVQQAQSEHQKRIEEFKCSWQKGREFKRGLFARNEQNADRHVNSLSNTHMAPS